MTNHQGQQNGDILDGGVEDDGNTQRVIAHKYLVTDKLGQGGCGTVYAAHQQLVDRKVVVKVIRPDLTSDQEMVDRFLLEARAASRVVHPNVVVIHDFGYSDDGTAYLVMEHVEGWMLGDALRSDGRLPWRRAVHIMRQVAEALAEAHARHVVHRDVKPANIMLTRRGTDPDFVKVLDFGIAKLRDAADQKLTATGTVLGTPSYMAPEQLEGKEVGPATDQYALGAVLYQMLVGRVPFRGDTMANLITKHLTETPEPPGQVAPDAGLPPALEAVVLRCLAKNPSERFEDMAALVAALDAVAAKGDSPASGTSKPRWPLVAGMAGLIAVAAIAGALFLGRSPESEPAPTDSPTEDPGEAAPLPELDLDLGKPEPYRIDGLPVQVPAEQE
ncbi:MAG: serine/threonine-protein kinase [Myxococcota bacterium]